MCTCTLVENNHCNHQSLLHLRWAIIAITNTCNTYEEQSSQSLVLFVLREGNHYNLQYFLYFHVVTNYVIITLFGLRVQIRSIIIKNNEKTNIEITQVVEATFQFWWKFTRQSQSCLCIRILLSTRNVLFWWKNTS